MARKLADIIAAMDAEQALQTELSGLNSPSQAAIYTLWKYIVALSQLLIEQLWDIYKIDLENQIKAAAVGSAMWFQSRVLAFQYSAVTPQVLVVGSDFSINYPVIDPALRIITRCSVKTTATKTVLIKVAKSDPPVALTGPELSSLSGYIDDLAFAGVNYIVTSVASDKIYVKGNIYYNGQYATTIQTSVITAINNYLANVPFDGNVKITALTDAIQAVTGVTDLVLEDVAIRKDTDAFSAKVYMIQNSTTLISSYQLYAGYVTEETTASNTFTDSLTFIAQQ